MDLNVRMIQKDSVIHSSYFKKERSYSYIPNKTLLSETVVLGNAKFKEERVHSDVRNKGSHAREQDQMNQ